MEKIREADPLREIGEICGLNESFDKKGKGRFSAQESISSALISGSQQAKRKQQQTTALQGLYLEHLSTRGTESKLTGRRVYALHQDAWSG